MAHCDCGGYFDDAIYTSLPILEVARFLESEGTA